MIFPYCSHMFPEIPQKSNQYRTYIYRYLYNIMFIYRTVELIALFHCHPRIAVRMSKNAAYFAEIFAFFCQMCFQLLLYSKPLVGVYVKTFSFIIYFVFRRRTHTHTRTRTHCTPAQRSWFDFCYWCGKAHEDKKIVDRYFAYKYIYIYIIMYIYIIFL